MPYRAQVFANFDWRVGYRPDPDSDIRFVARGTAASQATASSAIDAAITADRAARSVLEASRTVIFAQTYPD